MYKLDSLLTFNSNPYNFIIKKLYVDVTVNQGWIKYVFDSPFPNACLFASVLEDGIMDYEVFTVGHITNKQIHIYSASGRTGSDSICIFALGY